MSERKEKVVQNDETILTCRSVFGTKVVFTQRTLEHVIERHPEVLQLPELHATIKSTIENPDFIAKGRTEELVALRRISGTQVFSSILPRRW